MYPESTEQAAKLALLGLAGGLGNVFGLSVKLVIPHRTKLSPLMNFVS